MNVDGGNQMKSRVNPVAPAVLSITVLLTMLSCSFANEVNSDAESLLFMEVPTVVTAAMTEQSSEKAPGTITVVTENEIKLNGWQSLKEVFRSVPGFDLFFNAGSESIPVVRGVFTNSFNWVKVLLNGHTLNDTEQGQVLDFEDFNLANVKQIEIIRGPGSSLYGTSAFTAVINIITKDAPGLIADVSYGQNDYKRGYVSYTSVPKSGFSFSLHADVLRYIGPSLTIEKGALNGTPFELAPKQVDYDTRRNETGGIISYNNFTLTGMFVDYRSNWLQGLNGILAEEQSYSKNEMYFFDLQYKYALSDSLLMTINSSFDKYKFSQFYQYYPAGFTVPMDLNGDGRNESWPDGMFADVALYTSDQLNRILFNYSSPKNSVLLGLFYETKSMDEADVKSNGNFLYGFSYPGMVRLPLGENGFSQLGNDSISGIFAQDVHTFNDILSLIAGARYDKYSDWGETFNPRTALVMNFSENAIVKLNYAEAFSAPMFINQYVMNSIYTGDPNSRPERIKTYEISTQNSEISIFHYTITVFKNRITDYIGLTTLPDGSTKLTNFGNIDGQGVEIEAKYLIFEKLTVFGNSSYADTKDDTTNRPYRDAASTLGNIGFSWKIQKNWYVTPRMFFSGPREGNALIGTQSLPGYELVDLTVVGDIKKDISISLSAFNLFDKSYQSGTEVAGTSDVPMPGREIRLKVSVKM